MRRGGTAGGGAVGPGPRPGSRRSRDRKGEAWLARAGKRVPAPPRAAEEGAPLDAGVRCKGRLGSNGSGHSWGRAITAGGECSNAEGWSGRTWKNGAEKWSGRCLGGSHQVEFGVSPVPFGGPAGAEMTKSMLKSKRNQLKCSSALRAKW